MGGPQLIPASQSVKWNRGQRLCLALPAGGAAVGWMLLGPRPDGTLPRTDERDALEDIAEPVGRAIRVARRREADAISAQRRFERLEAAIRALKHQRSARPAPA